MRILNGRSLDLHELKEEDVSTLYLWRNSSDFIRLCSTRRNLVSLEEFRTELQSDLKKDRHRQFLIKRKSEFIGTIYSYNLNQTDGHVFVTIFIAEPWRNNGYGAEAVIVFLEYLFREHSLHKVYAEAYNYNTESLHALASGGFIEEGRFVDHRLFHGKRYDLVRLAFFRRQVSESSTLVERVTGRDPSYWL